MLPIEVSHEGEGLFITRRYTDAALNEHMIMMQKCAKTSNPMQWRPTGEIILNTSDWVRFLRKLGPSGGTIDSFSVYDPSRKEYFWRYSVFVRNRCVTLSKRYILEKVTCQDVQQRSQECGSISVSPVLYGKDARCRTSGLSSWYWVMNDKGGVKAPPFKLF